MNEHLEALIISVLESGFCEASVCSSLRRGRACPLYLTIDTLNTIFLFYYSGVSNVQRSN